MYLNDNISVLEFRIYSECRDAAARNSIYSHVKRVRAAVMTLSAVLFAAVCASACDEDSVIRGARNWPTYYIAFHISLASSRLQRNRRKEASATGRALKWSMRSSVMIPSRVARFSVFR